MNRPGQSEQRNDEDAEMRAFLDYARRGVMAPEHRALDSGTTGGATGGFTVPDNFVAELLRNIVQFSPIRTVAASCRLPAPT